MWAGPGLEGGAGEAGALTSNLSLTQSQRGGLSLGLSPGLADSGPRGHQLSSLAGPLFQQGPLGGGLLPRATKLCRVGSAQSSGFSPPPWSPGPLSCPSLPWPRALTLLVSAHTRAGCLELPAQTPRLGEHTSLLGVPGPSPAVASDRLLDSAVFSVVRGHVCSGASLNSLLLELCPGKGAAGAGGLTQPGLAVGTRRPGPPSPPWAPLARAPAAVP